jgi:catechol 2,3-dioxygenase-like lactoylglutathione lyase family enzyme
LPPPGRPELPVCDRLTMTTAGQPSPDSKPVGKLASISLDTTDPATLAEFYGRLLGMRRIYQRPDGSLIALSDGTIALTVMFAADHIPPTWPDPGQQQQLHLDIAVADLPGAVAAAVKLGATEARHQPVPHVWRVLLDPAGHPFCLTTAAGKLEL